MQKIILTIAKNEKSTFEAANGRYQFTSNKGESVPAFRFRINKHFMNSASTAQIFFVHEK